MKKLLLIPLLSLFLASCARDVEDVKTPGFDDSEGKQFLSVSIVSAGSATRAETTMDKGYKNGSDAENAVKKVRLYFFTTTGEPASVKYDPTSDTYLSYYDWYPLETEKGPENNDNIEKVVTAEVVLNTENKDKVPYSMMAVINPTEYYEGATSRNLSLTELEAIIKTHNQDKFTKAGTDDNGFVMSNSKYIDIEGNEVGAVPVVGHIFTTSESAKNNPVVLYVERVVARMDLGISQTPVVVVDEGKHPVYDTNVSVELINGLGEEDVFNKKIYVKFFGWNITATTDKSWLIKDIEPTWNIESLFGWTNEPWSEYLRFRSYWAINPAGVKFAYGNFGQALPDDAPEKLPYTSSKSNMANERSFNSQEQKDGRWITYMEENAAKDKDGFQEPFDNTKVIIAAQLVEKVGEDYKPLTLVEWGFNSYTLDGIKNLWAKSLDVFKKTKDSNGSYKITRITPDDIYFVSAGSLNEDLFAADKDGRAPEKKGRYYAYPQLKDDKNVEWTFSMEENAKSQSYKDANAMVQQIGPAKVWNSGYTYYYLDIAHLGAEEKPGEFGVVRNHIYDTDITEISGLGTPVYDPDEIIYPEKPDDDNGMIAAKINILTWRIVKKSFKLDW